MMDETPPITTHGDCPYCPAHGCYSEWANGGYYCHSCKIKSKGGTMTEADIEEEAYQNIRGISESVCETYKVTVGLDSLGKPVRHTYPYPHKDKYRWLPKDFSHNKGFSNDHLFGMDKFNASSGRTITVVEGELDALSAYQMLGCKWPVVSLPNASLSKALLENCHSYLNSFASIAVCTDNDAAGIAVANKLSRTFPGKVYKVSLTKHKDANAFLQAGDQKDFMFAWVNRERYVPSDIFNTKTQFRKILDDEETNTYIPTPITDFNDLCKGLMQGHLTVLTGPEGQGKTEVMRMLEADILMNHTDIPIAMLHMEESKKTCLLSLASYVLKTNLRDPDHTVPKDRVQEAVDSLSDAGNMYFFELGIDEDPLTILEKVRFLTEVYGCKYIFIDPIQQLSYGKTKDSTEEQMLSQISVQLERLATEFNVGIVVTSHVNDDGQTRSSRMIGKSASVRIDIKRDHMNPDPDVRNRTVLSVSKNRPIGPTGYAGTLVFDPETFILQEDI